MKIRFTVPGPPQGKGRPRFTRNGRTYTPKETAEYEKKIADCFKQQCGNVFFNEHVPIDVRITAYYPIPKSISKKKHMAMIDHIIRPTQKPDADNIMKCLDAINKIAFHDDAQIVDAQVWKFYSDDPRLVITIQEATHI